MSYGKGVEKELDEETYIVKAQTCLPRECLSRLPVGPPLVKAARYLTAVGYKSLRRLLQQSMIKS